MGLFPFGEGGRRGILFRDLDSEINRPAGRSAEKMLTRIMGIFSLAAGALIALPAPAAAAPGNVCAPYGAVPDVIAGTSTDSLGNWVVRYERIVGGNPDINDAINDVIDAEARGQVATYEPSASKTLPWTLNIDGHIQKRPVTVSALFTGEYNDPQPNMPFHAVATRVFDCRSGILIDWDNLFTNKLSGLTRLSEETQRIIPTVYAPPTHPGVWQFGSEVAPVDANFRFWIPTDRGIELHFPDWQFGRGVAVITVGWAAVKDLIVPEFQAITG
ncbi:DUF3298 domain-containing protein [Mycolicibacterium insubricum]|uniref:DUF3298 domain-containing protein n=1 Tax=Mycolicibacterium insubricum TaxID=444597 RepID=UPI001F34229D|nr:DUF3298 domain-containing protein [Mycolicibacterium insubricum]